jgi:hypothetical protein
MRPIPVRHVRLVGKKDDVRVRKSFADARQYGKAAEARVEETEPH